MENQIKQIESLLTELKPFLDKEWSPHLSSAYGALSLANLQLKAHAEVMAKKAKAALVNAIKEK